MQVEDSAIICRFSLEVPVFEGVHMGFTISHCFSSGSFGAHPHPPRLWIHYGFFLFGIERERRQIVGKKLWLRRGVQGARDL
jgi:hypothetical protein